MILARLVWLIWALGWCALCARTAVRADVRFSLWANVVGDIFASDSLADLVLTRGPTDSNFSAIAGTGFDSTTEDLPARKTRIEGAQALTGDDRGILYFVESRVCRVRAIHIASTRVHTVVGRYQHCTSSGDGGDASSATINSPSGVFFEQSRRRLYITESLGGRVRVVNIADATITTLAGTGTDGLFHTPRAPKLFLRPTHVWTNDGDVVFVNDEGSKQIIRSQNGISMALDGTWKGNMSGLQLPGDAIPTALCGSGTTMYVFYSGAWVLQVNGSSSISAQHVAAGFDVTSCHAFGDGNIVVSVRSDTLEYSLFYWTLLPTSTPAHPTPPAVEAKACNTSNVHCSLGADLAAGRNGGSYGVHSTSSLFASALHPRRLDGNANYPTSIPTTMWLSPRGTGDSVYTYAGMRSTDSTEDTLLRGHAVHVDTDGNIYITDELSGAIKVLYAGASRVTMHVGCLASSCSNNDGAQGQAAALNNPWGLTGDSVGNLYVSEMYRCQIRVVSVAKVLSTLAGKVSNCTHSGDGGPASAATLQYPRGIFLETVSNKLYVAEYEAHVIRVVDIATKVISTIAGTHSQPGNIVGLAATSCQLNHPIDVWANTAGDLFIANFETSRVVQVSNADGLLTVFAGTGNWGYNTDVPATSADMPRPSAVCGDSAGSIYVMHGFYYLRKIDSGGIISTLAGNLSSLATIVHSRTNNATAVVAHEAHSCRVDKTGSVFFQAVNAQVLVRVSGGVSTVLHGFTLDQFPMSSSMSRLFDPHGMWEDSAGDLYIADGELHRIYAFSPSGQMRVHAGVGDTQSNSNSVAATYARFNSPQSLAGDSSGTLYVADFYNRAIRIIDGTTKMVSTLALTVQSVGAPTSVIVSLTYPKAIVLDEPQGKLYVADTTFAVKEVDLYSNTIRWLAGSGVRGADDGAFSFASFGSVQSMWLSSSGSLYLSDYQAKVIREADLVNGIVHTVVGDGTNNYAGDQALGTSSGIGIPLGICGDDTGLLVSSVDFSRMVRYSFATKRVTVMIGKGDFTMGGEYVPRLSSFVQSQSCLVSKSGELFFTEQARNTFRIRKTLAWAPTSQPSSQPTGRPSAQPFCSPSSHPSSQPSSRPSPQPTSQPTVQPSIIPTCQPTSKPSALGYSISGAGDLMFTYTGVRSSTPTADIIVTGAASYRDSSGNTFVADWTSSSVRRIDALNGSISAYVGSSGGYSANDGAVGTAVDIGKPFGVSGDTLGNIYYSDTITCLVRKVNPNRVVTTVAGLRYNCSSGVDGILAIRSPLNGPRGIFFESNSNSLYIVERLAHRLRVVNMTSGIVRLIAGTTSMSGNIADVVATFGKLSLPDSVWVSSGGDIYIADTGNNVVRKVLAATGIMTTFAGNASAALLSGVAATASCTPAPATVCGDTAGNIYVAHATHFLRKVSTDGIITTLIGGANKLPPDYSARANVSLVSFADVASCTVDLNGAIYVFGMAAGVLWKVQDGMMTALSGTTRDQRPVVENKMRMAFVAGIWEDSMGSLYFTDGYRSSVFVTQTPGKTYLVVGGGAAGFNGNGIDATLAMLNGPRGLSGDSMGNVYIADSENRMVRILNRTTGTIGLVAGNRQMSCVAFTGSLIAANTALCTPYAIAVDSVRNVVYFSDDSSYIKAVVMMTGMMQIVAGNGTRTALEGSPRMVGFGTIRGLWVSSTGLLFVADRSKMLIRVVDWFTNQVKTVAGDGSSTIAWNNAVATSTGVGYVEGVCGDATGIFIVSGSSRIGWLSFQTGRVRTFVGSGSGPGGEYVSPILSGIGAARACHVSRSEYLYFSEAVNDVYRVRKVLAISPTSQPTSQPSVQPSAQPTHQPSQPSSQPTSQPSCQPVSRPTAQPSCPPSSQPTIQPTEQPTYHPSSQPSAQPSMRPSGTPSEQPTSQPSVQPSDNPSTQPSPRPSSQPTFQPTMLPTGQPTSQPTGCPTAFPSALPTAQPYTTPSAQPSIQPTLQPRSSPTAVPSASPSSRPSITPSLLPTGQPSARPSLHPSGTPSTTPSAAPTVQPSFAPSGQPTLCPTGSPSSGPTGQPTCFPTAAPFAQPTGQPSQQPVGVPTTQPSSSPTSTPSVEPSIQPTSDPTSRPSYQPNSPPTVRPSLQPTSLPTGLPTSQPSIVPSNQPTRRPSSQPTSQPNTRPSAQPSRQPQSFPSAQPSSDPSVVPTSQPSHWPTLQPTAQPSGQPSLQPYARPSAKPSMRPSMQPICAPTGQPSVQPSRRPLSRPSGQPSRTPTVGPSAQPTEQPSPGPSSQPSAQPTAMPTYLSTKVLSVADASFSSDGKSVEVRLSQPTSMLGQVIGQSFPCQSVLIFPGAASYACIWKSDAVIVVSNTINPADLIPGSLLRLSEDTGLRVQCLSAQGHVASNTFFCPATVVNSTAVVCATATAPLVPLIGDFAPSANISSCSEWQLDFATITGSAGRPWAVLECSVRTLSLGSDASVIQANMRSQVNRTSLVIIGSVFLTKGEQYAVDVRVCNFLGACASRTMAVSVSTGELVVPPVVSFAGTNGNLTMLSSAQLRVSADAYTMRCGSLTTRSTAGLLYRWRLRPALSNLTNPWMASMWSRSKSPSIYLLPSFTLLPDKVYVLQLTVTDSNTNLTEQEQLRVTVTPSSIAASLSPSASQSLVRAGESLILNATGSFDPDRLALLNFSWFCLSTSGINLVSEQAQSVHWHPCGLTINLLASGVVQVVSTATNTNTTSLISVTAAEVATAHPAHAARNSSAFTQVTVIPPANPVITILTSAVEVGYVNTDVRLMLRSTVRVTSTPCIASWIVSRGRLRSNASTAFTVLVPATKLTNVNLYVGANVLYGSATYVFSVTCGGSSAFISVSTNSPPLRGRLHVQPERGYPLNTSFLMSTDQWVDNDLPLAYSFSYQSLTDATVSMPLRGGSQISVAYALLPASAEPIIAQALAEDSMGAASKLVTFGVTIIPVPVSVLSQLINRALSSSSDLSKDEQQNLISVATSMANVVDCSLAPNCTRLHRSSCLATANTCGACQSGYLSTDGGSGGNSECLALSAISASTLSVKVCASSLDCSSWQVCNTTRQCEDRVKPCDMPTCSSHGSCQYLSKSTGLGVTRCPLISSTCEVVCRCESGYGGSACNMTTEEVSASQSLRAQLLENLVRVIAQSDNDATALVQAATSLATIARDQYDLNANATRLVASLTQRILTQANVLDSQTVLQVARILSPVDAALTALSMSPQSNSSAALVGNFSEALSVYQTLLANAAQSVSEVYNTFRVTTQVIDNVPASGSINVPIALTDQEKALQAAGQLSVPSVSISPVRSNGTAAVTNISVAVLVMGQKEWKNNVTGLSSDIVVVQATGTQSVDISIPPRPLPSTPALNFSVTCPARIIVIKNYTCVDSGYVGHVQCKGVAGTVIGRCPVLAQTCTALNLVTQSVAAGQQCKAVNSSSSAVTCRCNLAAYGGSVAAGLVVKYVGGDFANTFKVASAFGNSAAIGKTYIIIALYSTLWGSALVASIFFWSDYRKADHHSKKLAVEGMPAQHSSIRSLKRFYGSVHPNPHCDAALGEHGGEPDVRHETQLRLAQYVEAVFPAVFSATSVMGALRDELWAHHLYINFFFRLRAQHAPVLEVLKLMSSQSFLLFLLAVLYDLSYPDDDGTCPVHTSVFACLKRTYLLDNKRSYCQWVVNGANDQDGCSFANPTFSFTTAMYVSMVISLATCLAMEPLELLIEQLAAPTLQSLPRELVVDYDVLERGVSLVGRSEMSQQESVGHETTSVLWRRYLPHRVLTAQRAVGCGAVEVATLMRPLLAAREQGQAQVIRVALRQLAARGEAVVAAPRMLSMGALERDLRLQCLMLKEAQRPSFEASWGLNVNGDSFLSVRHRSWLGHSEAVSVKSLIQAEIAEVNCAADVGLTALSRASGADRGFEILRTFVLDLLGRKSPAARIFAIKTELDCALLSPVSWRTKASLGGVLAALDVFFVFYAVLKGYSKGLSWQADYVKAWGFQLLLDIFLFETLLVIWIHFCLPYLVSSEVRRAYATVQRCVERLYDPDHYRGVACVDATQYLFVSTRLAQAHPNLVESALVRSFASVLPGATARSWLGPLHAVEQWGGGAELQHGGALASLLVRLAASVPLSAQRMLLRALEPVLFSGLTLAFLFFLRRPIYLAVLSAVVAALMMGLLWDFVRVKKVPETPDEAHGVVVLGDLSERPDSTTAVDALFPIFPPIPAAQAPAAMVGSLLNNEDNEDNSGESCEESSRESCEESSGESCEESSGESCEESSGESCEESNGEASRHRSIDSEVSIGESSSERDSLGSEISIADSDVCNSHSHSSRSDQNAVDSQQLLVGDAELPTVTRDSTLQDPEEKEDSDGSDQNSTESSNSDCDSDSSDVSS